MIHVDSPPQVLQGAAIFGFGVSYMFLAQKKTTPNIRSLVQVPTHAPINRYKQWCLKINVILIDQSHGMFEIT